MKLYEDCPLWVKFGVYIFLSMFAHVPQVPARVALGVTTLLAMSTTQVPLANVKSAEVFVWIIFWDLSSGKYPELSATGGIHEGHRRLVWGLRLLRLQRPPWVRPCQLCLQVGEIVWRSVSYFTCRSKKETMQVCKDSLRGAKYVCTIWKQYILRVWQD